MPSETSVEINPPERPLRILILYDRQSIHIGTVRDHLECFARFSRHQVSYSPATGPTSLNFSLEPFDVVIIHYTVRLAYRWHISPAYALALRSFRGLKAIFIQDEYDNTWQACKWINGLGVGLVFTCVPPQHAAEIYSLADPGRVRFAPTLTGYVPMGLQQIPPPPPLRERRLVIGYRGRELAFRYGMLAREKLVIGQRFREICRSRGIAHDIDWSETSRIYGPAWLHFLGSCRATLGAESGSNVFDFDGSLTRTIDQALKENRSATFEEIHEKYLRSHERDGLMNQISPRVFEAVATRTGLIMFEGEYSGIVQPDEHYLALKKDFSNVDDVLRQVQDDTILEPMIERAYRHVLGSGKYTYRQFVEGVDDTLSQHARPLAQNARTPIPDNMGDLLSPQLPPAAAWNAPAQGERTGVHEFVTACTRSTMRLAKIAAQKAGGAFVARNYKRLRTAHRLVHEDQVLREAWCTIRAEPRCREAFGSWLASRREFLHLALLRSACTASAICYMPWLTQAEYDATTGCLQFKSYALYESIVERPAVETLREVRQAIQRGTVKEVVWKHGTEMTKFAIAYTADKAVEFPLDPDGVFRFAGIERLIAIRPDLVLRLVEHIVGLDTPASVLPRHETEASLDAA